MSLLKEMVARGIYYERLGVHDYEIWSEMMVEYYGTGIRKDIREIRKWAIAIPEKHDISIARLNCWEFMGCSVLVQRTQGEKEASALCPAAAEKRLDGIHGGENAGRACWMVSHTHCNRTVQGSREEKAGLCMKCDFYLSVYEEEGLSFITPGALKGILKKGNAADGTMYQH